MISVMASVKFCLFEKLVCSLFHSKKNTRYRGVYSFSGRCFTPCERPFYPQSLYKHIHEF